MLGSCITFLKDLENRRFGKLSARFFGNQVLSESPIFQKYYSIDLLHRVQKGLREGGSIPTEVPDAEERFCADFIEQIISGYHSGY